MKWVHNVAAFAPSNPYLADLEETTWEEIPKIHKNGQDYVYVSVKDNTMYDRYIKGDLVIIKLDENPETSVVGDALVLLPDDTVCLKQIKFGAKKVKLIDRIRALERLLEAGGDGEEADAFFAAAAGDGECL